MTVGPPPAPRVPVTSRAALPPLHPLGRGTLSRRLVVRVAAIVALVALVLGLVSTLAVRQIMIAQLDDQLDAALSREESSRDDKDEDDRDDHPVGVFLPGMRIGTIILESAGDNAWRISQVSEGTPNRLDESVARDLLQVPLDGEKHTITVGSLGAFRAEAIDSDRGQVVVADEAAAEGGFLLGGEQRKAIHRLDVVIQTPQRCRGREGQGGTGHGVKAPWFRECRAERPNAQAPPPILALSL